MQQRTFFVKSKEELNSVVNEISESAAYKNASGRLLIIYSNFFKKDEVADYVTEIKLGLPEIKVAGISVVTSSRYWDERGLTLSFCLFEDSKVEVYSYKRDEYDEDTVANEFSSVLDNIEDVKTVFFFPSNMALNSERVLNAISRNNKDICILGAMAASAMGGIKGEGDHFQNFEVGYSGADVMETTPSFYIADDSDENGFVFAVVSGKRLQLKKKYIFGWHPLGKDMFVTGRLGEEDANACITEIDNIPSTMIYHRYFGVEADQFFMANVCEFPMTLVRGDLTVGRIPLPFGKDGELYFPGDIRDGEPIRLGYANPTELLRETERASLELKKFEPEALFAIVCFNRFLFLKEREKEEIRFLLNVTKDMAFCYGGFEIYKNGDQGGILNGALVAIGMKEAEEAVDDELDQAVLDEELQTPKDKIIPIYQRLLTFIDASTRDLEKALEAARQASISKSAFLSNMSHEIRTPINAILGMDEMILRESTEKDIVDYAENIRRAGNNLLGIVNDILDFSKIEAGKLEIVPVEYEVSSLLNDLINMIKKRAEDKGLDLIVRIDENIPFVLYGDEIRIKQILTNILTNAVKYTEKGNVTLNIQRKKTEAGFVDLRVEVSDTGIGIKEEDLPKLFDAFERIDEKRNRTIEGAGLGMNITRNLLNAMGSKLEVSSVYGEGSKFAFDISQRIVKDMPIGNFEEALKRSIASRNRYHESFTAPDAKILVVDDTVINLTVIEGLLKRTLLNIDTATSGEECIEKVRNTEYDLIFLDHRMPKMDGVETLQKIREEGLADSEKTRIVALTANAVSGSREYYFSVGFDGYLSKPIDPMALESVILSHLLPKGLAIVNADEDKDIDTSDKEEISDWLMHIQGIDPDKGIANCGSAASFEDAVRVYEESADDNLENIEHYFQEKDIENYTTKVHALKSSSRIIGAMKLGQLSEDLEKAGSEKNYELINNKTEILLAMYRELVDSIRKSDPLQEEADMSVKEPIPETRLKEAYEAMGEFAQMFDYDSLMMVINSLEEYSLEEQENERLHDLKAAALRADWDTINSILEGWKNR